MSEDTWKLVPIVPTVDMIVAATEQWLCISAYEDRAEVIWDAMLAAAPTHPNREGVDLDELEKVARRVAEMEDPFDGPTFDSVHDAMDAGCDFQQAFDPPTVLKLIALARLNPPAAS